MKDAVIESRVDKDGYRVRVYRREDGSRYRTVEVPIEAFRSKETKARIEMSVSASERTAKRARAAALLANGWSVDGVVNRTGLSKSTVYELRARLPAAAEPKAKAVKPEPVRVASVFDLGRG